MRALFSDSQGRRSLIPGLLVVLVVSAALLLIVRATTPSLSCPDGFFHIRFAEVLRTQGLSRSFPWWQETFLRDRWADKDLLLHILLIPFTFGDLLLGAKIASVVFASAAMGVFYLSARALKVRLPAIWTLALLASSSAFLFRLGFTRGWVLAMALAIGGSCAILLGRPGWTFALSALYPGVHISYHLLPCVALFHDLQQEPVPGRRRSFRISAWALAGTITGATLSPYFPNNLYLWWVQNVRVLGMAWQGPRELRLGLELLPRGSEFLLKDNLGAFIAIFLGVWFLMRTGRASAQARTLLAVACGFGALAMLSYVFIEFLVPFGILFAAVAARDAGKAAGDQSQSPGSGADAPPAPGESSRGVWGRPRARRRTGLAGRRALAVLLTMAGVALAVRNTVTARRSNAVSYGMSFAGASTWLNANVPAGETIFHLDWDDFPELFFFNPQFRYLVGLDPTFMYVTDPKRWRLLADVGNGETEDIFGAIRETFHCRWVCVKSRDWGFLSAARRDPRFVTRYEDATASVFSLDVKTSLVSRWRVFGWFPDPARTLLDLPLGPELGALPATGDEGLEAFGPAAGGTQPRVFAGFVDLERALDVPPAVTDVCGLAEAELLAPASEVVTLGVTTDDEVVVRVDGAQVLEASPFRHPPPGSPAGPPVQLGDSLGRETHTPERTARVTLHAGRNKILVKCCRSGEDFGFVLRAWREDGSAVAEGL